jgi:hypothetical protein
MHGLSKSKIIAHRQCPKRLWLQTYRPELATESATSRLAMQSGNRIGEAARTLFPGGILIDATDLRAALEQTRTALAAHPEKPLFEATFEHNSVLVRADVLVPGRNGAELIEVKGSASVKDYHVEDAAIQAWVIRAAGIPLKSIQVAHADKRFRYPGGGDYTGLIKPQEVTQAVDAFAPQIADWVAAARATLAGPEPGINCGSHCKVPYECPFMNHCTAAEADPAEYPIDELYRAHPKQKATLRAAGYTDIRQIPSHLLKSEQQFRIREAAITGRPYLDDVAGAQLRAAPYPRHYFDFETISVGCPVWPGTGPHLVIPFQWSCHTESAPGVLEHREFLATGTEDPRRECAESLIAALADDGPIYAYHAQFEKLRLRELADHFPDLALTLKGIANRLTCLEKMTLASYYHPDMHGTWSLKYVLPTVAPHLDYANLAVRDGVLAQEAFLEMMEPQTSAERRSELRRHLLDYCGRDTEALVCLAHFLEGANAG